MANLLTTVNKGYQPPSQFAAKLLFVALAYFVSGRLGLAIPYVGSHITLIWLPTGIAVAALIRWGYICWPGIFLGALATNFSIDSSPLLDSSIALGNTLGPLLAAWLLRRLKFHGVLDRAYDILLLVVAAAIGMLVSASGGVSSLLIFKVLPMQDAGAAWLSWSAGDFVGVLLAAPLLLNISRAELKKLWAQRVEFLVWCMTTLAISWWVFFANNSEISYSHQMAFTVLPTVVWVAMRFGVIGSSLGVLLPVLIAALATGRELGPFYTEDAQRDLFQLWLFFFTVVLVELMVVAMQAGRKKAEQTTREAKERIEIIFNTSPDAVLISRLSDGYITDVNNAFAYLSGHTKEESIGNTTLGLNLWVNQDDRQKFIDELQTKGFCENFEAQFRKKDGSQHTGILSAGIIKIQGISHIVSTTRDITEYKRAEEVLRESEARTQLILDMAMDAVISTNQEGRVIGWNREAERMFGYAADHALGKDLSELIVPLAYRKAHQQGMQHFVKTGSSTIIGKRIEITGMRADGSEIPVELTIVAVLRQGSYFFNAFVRDITERNRIQMETMALLQRNQLLMKTAMDGIHVMDMQGNIAEANDAFCNMLGYSQEEMVSLNVADFNTQYTAEQLRERFRSLIGKSARFETMHRRKDGKMIDVEISTASVEIDGQYYFIASSRDITERKKVEQELRDSERKSRMLMDSAADAVFVADPQTECWVYVNDRFESLLGYSRAELLASNIYDYVTPAFRDIYRERFRSIAQSGGVSTRELQLNRKDGTSVPLEMNAVTLPDGTVYGACRDITERKRADEALRIAATTFNAQEGILITDADAKILRVNQAFQDIAGYGADEVIGCNPRIFQSGRHDAAFYQAMWSALLNTGKWSGEVWDRRKDGSIYPKLMTITAVYDDRLQITHYVAVFRDITMRKESEQAIHRLAFYDSLTMLPNRRLLLDRLQRALVVSARNGRHGALLFLDMDHFKTINDTQGHAMGDQLLIEVARRLQTCVREGDSVARLGGDEFVVVLEELSSEADEAATQTELVAEKIRSELGQPYILKDYECLSTASIGISLFSGHPESAEDLLMHADVAMYQAKTAGRNAIRFFDPQMQTALEARAALEADLRHALEKQQFCLYYQIQVDSLRRPLGAEVLLRWEHPERGLVAPEHFIPTAEETGLIVPIGLWVLQTACAQLKEWQNDALTRDLTLAVNVSAKQFRQADFVAQAQRMLLESGAKPSHLKLEFTESTVLENVEDTISKMRELKILGVGFSMDDFGTGYSSLQYLKRLPLDQIKIDQSFVRDIVSDPNDAAIVQTIIAMTEALGLNVIAEGVETEAQREFLDDHGCHAFQGFLFGKPMTVKRFKGLLSDMR